MNNKNGIPILPSHARTKPFDMSPKRHPRYQCWGKVKHRNRGSAIAHARAAGPEYAAYACPWCRGMWHIGHSTETLVYSIHLPAAGNPPKP